MKRILVTGGAGFIGANFVHYLLASDATLSVINLDALTYAGSLDNLNDLRDSRRHEFVHGDIANGALVLDLLRKYEVDAIVHFAAETHVDRSILQPGRFIQTNVVGSYTLLEAARQVWLDERHLPSEAVRFHHISTDEVFGMLAPGDPAFREETLYAPNSPYSASKAASDHLVRAYWHTYGLPITITNCSNNYGPYQFTGKLIPLVITNACQGLPLPVYGDGRQIRDWLHVGDHCAAIAAVLERGKPGETYLVGGDNQPTNLDIIQIVCAILDELAPDPSLPRHSSLIQFVSDRPGHDRRYALNTNKIRTAFDWQPAVSLEAGLHRTVEWYLANQNWLATITARPEYQDWLARNYQQRKNS